MDCQIVSVADWSGKKARIAIEPNPFHVSGGGQPGDSGLLTGPGFKAEVKDCRKGDDGAYLDVKITQGEPQVAMVLDASVDRARNELLSRMHSGEHLLSKVMERSRSDVHIYKVAVGEKATSVFFRAAEVIDWDFLFAAEQEANAIAAQGRSVTVQVLPVDEAKKLPNLKANWDRITDSEIRVVEIEDLDCIACSGSHVTNTLQIGEIFIESFKGGPEEWELTFSLGAHSSKEDYGRIMRRLLHRLNCKPSELERSVDRLNSENKSLTKTLSRLRDYVVLPHEDRTAGSLTVSLFNLPGVPKDMAMACLSARSQELPGGLVLGLFDDGQSEKIPFALLCGAELSLPLKDLIKAPELAIKGGGSSAMLSGVTACKAPSDWLAALERLGAAKA